MKKKLETILFNCQITKKIPIAPDIWAKEPTENVHLHPNHNALSYDLILRWALLMFLCYLVLVFWVRKEETKIKPYISMVLWRRTGKVTVSPLPIVLLLFVRDGFLQLCHRDGEVATPRCPPTWADTSQSQDLSPLHAHGKQRTKWGAVVLPEPLPLPGSQGCPSRRWEMPLPKAGANRFHIIQAKYMISRLLIKPLIIGIRVSVQKLRTGQPIFILKASGIWEGEIACFFKKISFNIKMLARLAILIKS